MALLRLLGTAVAAIIAVYIARLIAKGYAIRSRLHKLVWERPEEARCIFTVNAIKADCFCSEGRHILCYGVICRPWASK